jgi:hypothetical protein
MYLLRRHTNATLREVAGFFPGIGYAGVSLAVRRIAQRRGQPDITQLIEQGEAALLKVKT